MDRNHRERARPGGLGHLWGVFVIAVLAVATLVMADIAFGWTAMDQLATPVNPIGSPSAAVRATASHAPSASPTPAGARLEPYADEQDGYAMLLPPAWLATLSHPSPGVTHMGTARAGDGVALTISIGQPDGSIVICELDCTTVTVGSVDELERTLVSMWRAFGSEELHGDTTLGGIAARVEKPSIRHNCLGCPGMRYHVFAIREGRPIVLTFNYWNVVWGSLGGIAEDGSFNGSDLDAMLDSFRFPPTPPKSVRFVDFPDLGFMTLASSGSESVVGPDRATIDRPNGSFLVTVGDPVQGAAFELRPGVEERIRAPSVDAAVAALRRLEGVEVAAVDPVVVDGEEGRLVSVDGAQPLAVVMHRDRLFVVRAVPATGADRPSVAAIEDFVATIEFIDPTTTIDEAGGFELRHPDNWSFDGNEILPGRGRVPDVRLQVSVAPLGAEIRISLGLQLGSKAISGASLDDLLTASKVSFARLGQPREITLDGERAVQWTSQPRSYVNPLVAVVLVVHRDRVYVLSETFGTGASSTPDFSHFHRLVDGFRFRN